MSLSTYYLEYGRHLARLRHRRRTAVAAAVVVRTRPRAMLLAMTTMRKSTHGFPFLGQNFMLAHISIFG